MHLLCSRIDAILNVWDALPADATVACVSYLSIGKLGLKHSHVLMAFCLCVHCCRPHVNILRRSDASSTPCG